MKTPDLSDPTVVDNLLSSLERHPFATLSVIVLVALTTAMVVAWKRRE